ncbi:MAG: hypothetical protein ACFFB9_17105 [Promethearchaeota archaeon]
MVDKDKKNKNQSLNFLNLIKFKQVDIIGKKGRRKRNLKINIISKIKRRSKKKKVLNEISKDIEKVKLKPKNLILLDYINKKISNP